MISAAMISVEEALERILGYMEVLEPEEKPILEALGQVLAEDVYSEIDIPPLDNSGMDGYAVRAQDTEGASEFSPRLLRVIGEVAAGYPTEQEVGPGTAIRIMTGAAIPRGADTVVRFEDTDEELRKSRGESLSQIGVLYATAPGLNIRRAGEDIRKGSLVLEKGRPIRPSEIGVLASLGRARARVIRRPAVAVLATGDELVELGQSLPPGCIYNSNSYSLAGQIRRYGGIPKMLGIARDTVADTAQKLREGLGADMLITSAGVSIGEYDLVKKVLAEHGEITFWTVRMRPGKPLAFGLLKGQDARGQPRKVPHLGLPGNPVSSMVAFEQFARPAILKMMGKRNLTKPTVEAILEEDVEKQPGFRFFGRAVVTLREGRYYASITGPQGSGILTSMVQANGLIVIPEDVEGAHAGERVRVQMLDWSEE